MDDHAELDHEQAPETATGEGEEKANNTSLMAHASSRNWIHAINDLEGKEPWRERINKLTVERARHASNSARIRIWEADIVGWHLDVAFGYIVPTQGQLIAAGRLLNKTLPDLKATEVSGTITHKIEQPSREELDARMLAMGLDPNAEWARLKPPVNQ